MELSYLLQKKSISAYQLAKLSGVAYSTISDILHKRSNWLDCTVLTVKKLADALDMSIEELIQEDKFDFDLFRSEICQYVKRVNDLNFIKDVLSSNNIRKYYQAKQYHQAFYLLAMIDYLSRLHNLPLCKDYDDIRKMKLSKTIYPKSLLLESKITNNKSLLQKAKENAIPEFIRFNIVENEIRNVA